MVSMAALTEPLQSPADSSADVQIGLSLLGPPRLTVGGHVVAPGARKALGLLAVVALDGRSTRARLASLFWPELDGNSARRNLRRELHRLRSTGAATAWQEDGETLSLSHGVQVDVALFLGALDRGDLDLALTTYRGALLDGFDLAGAGAFDTWAAAQRETLTQRFRDAVQAQVALHEAAGRWREALACQLRLVDEEVPQEAHCRNAMRLHGVLGEREAALQLFERFRRRLGRELGLRPMPETLALADRLRRGDLAPAPAPVSTIAVKPAVDEAASLPFAGRADALADIQAGLTRGQTVWLLGEPGIGKTRLALEATAGRGACVWVGALADDAELPYATLTRLLRERLDEPALAGLPAWVQRELAHLLPELGTAPGPLSGDSDRLRLHAAATEALRQHWPAAARSVVFEDWHAADPATLGWWAQARASGAMGSDHIVTARDDSLPPLLRQWLETGQQRGHDVALFLIPLTPSAVAQLLGHPGVDSLSNRLAQATGGNPYFLAQTLQHLVQTGWLYRTPQGIWRTRDDTEGVVPLPSSVSQAVQARLATLDDATRRLLEAASLAGGSFDAADLAGATALTDFEQVSALERARAVRLLEHDSAGALRFTHELLAQALAERLSPERQRLLHRRLAKALERRGAPPARIASHLERAGTPAAALPWRLAAATAAEAVAAHEQALGEYEAALANGPPAPQATHIRLRRAAALQRLGRMADAETTLASAEDEAVATGDGAGALAVQLAMAELWGCTNRVAVSLARVDALLADEVLTRTQQAEALEIRADALLRQGEATAAEAALDEAVDRLPAGPSAQRGKLLLGAGRARFYRGDMDGAARCLDGAVRAYTAIGTLEPLAKATYMRGAIEMHRANPTLALRWLERGRALAERAGSVPVQRGAILNIVKMLTQTGRVPEALAALQAGEALSPVYENATIEAAFVQSHYYCQVLQGDIDGALARLPAVLATGDACVDVYWRVGARQLVVDLLLLTGRLDHAAELLDQARALCDDDRDGHHLPLVLAKQAWLRLLQGDAAGALALLAPTDEATFLAEAVDVRRHVEAAARLSQGDATAALALLADPGAASTEESKALQWAVRLQAEVAAGHVQAASLAAVAQLLAGLGSLPALEADVLRRVRDRVVSPTASPGLVLR